MDNKIEQVAAAIANRRAGRRGAPEVTNVLDILKSFSEGKLYLEVMDDARAAIEAMREPTGAMNDAAAVELPQLVRPGANYQVEIDDDAGTQIWYVMIREALKEPT